LAIAVALGVPWLVYRDTGPLTLSEATLATLTPTARDALTQRQATIKEFQNILPWACVIVAFSGVVLVFSGGKRMRDAQHWEDRGLRARTQREEASIRPQTSEERQRRMAEDLAEQQIPMVKSNMAPPTSGSTTATLAKPGAQDEGSQVVSPMINSHPSEAQLTFTTRMSPRRSASPSLREAWDIDREILARLAAITPDSYVLHKEVGVSRGESQILMDGLLRSKQPTSPDVLIEIKTFRGFSSGWARLPDLVLAAVVRYRDMTERSCVGWLIAVTDDDNSFPIKSLSRMRDRLGRYGSITLIRREEIDSLALPDIDNPYAD
jgi:hypothetical protein